MMTDSINETFPADTGNRVAITRKQVVTNIFRKTQTKTQ